MLFTCEVVADDATGGVIEVLSSVNCALSGMEFVVTDMDGRILAQQKVTDHMSPIYKDARRIPIGVGKSTIRVSVPISGVGPLVPRVKVRLVGRLSGSNHARVCSTDTKEVNVGNDAPKR